MGGKSMGLALSNSVRLARNVNKVLLYGDDPRDSASKRMIIHPLLGVALALCDGERDWAQLVNDYAFILDTTPQNAEHQLESFRNMLPGVIVETEGEHRHYDPSRFVIPVGEIDLDPSRWDAPFNAVLLLTLSCIRHCVYCYAERGYCGTHMPLSRVLELLDEMAELGVCTVQLTGGDPFCHPDVLSVLARATQRGLDMFTSTKSPLSEAEMDALATMGLQEIQISIDSSNQEIADILTASRGYLQEMAPVIQGLAARGVVVLSNVVITPLNIQTVPETIDWLLDLGVRDIAITPYGRSLYYHQDGLFLSSAHREILADSVAEAKTRHPGKRILLSGQLDPSNQSPLERSMAFEKRNRCSAGREAVVILPDGKVQSCEQIPTSDHRFIVGDLMVDSLLDVWRSARVQQAIAPPRSEFRGTVCAECSEFESCHNRGWCFRNSLLAYGTPYAPDPLCPKAPTGRRLT
jgi:radical SAM protein with 4Fe4S-binding SPASM domain